MDFSIYGWITLKSVAFTDCPSLCAFALRRVYGSYVVHQFNGTELHCAPLTCVVHHWPALWTMLHKGNLLSWWKISISYHLDGAQCDVVSLCGLGIALYAKYSAHKKKLLNLSVCGTGLVLWPCIALRKNGSQNSSSWGAVWLSVTQLLLRCYFGATSFLNMNDEGKWPHPLKRLHFSKWRSRFSLSFFLSERNQLVVSVFLVIYNIGFDIQIKGDNNP